MATQSRSPDSPRHGPTATHRASRLLAGLFLVTIGFMIFRALLAATEDTLLALMGLVVLFLLVASLFAGDRQRRL